MQDLYNNIKVVHLHDAETITDVTDSPSLYVDLAGFESALVLVNVGVMTNQDANNYIVPTLQSCNADPNLNASWAAVAAGDIQGGLSKIDAAAEDSTTQVAGYIGSARYLRVLLDITTAGANPDNIPVSVDAVLGMARHQPASGITVTTGTSNG